MSNIRIKDLPTLNRALATGDVLAIDDGSGSAKVDFSTLKQQVNNVTVITKTITTNGVYDAADEGAYGYSEVTVDVASGGIPLLSQSQWQALTVAQKQEYGLVAIQSASSGVTRGSLVYGAEDIYLPYSDARNIKCQAYWANFDSSLTTWGNGDEPVHMASACSQYQSEDAVYFNAKSGAKAIWINLENTLNDFTIYVIAKGLVYASGDVIVMGTVNQWSQREMMTLYHRSGTVWRTSVYGDDTDLLDTQGKYVAVAMRSGSMKAAWFASNGASRTNVSYNRHGAKFTFGSYGTTYSTDLAVKFVGYVNAADSDANVANNLANLASIFGVS